MTEPTSTAGDMTLEYQNKPMIDPRGFREYDTRWILGRDINLPGLVKVGAALGELFQRDAQANDATYENHKTTPPRVIVGHDFRSYSNSVKYALITGLMNSGCHVLDIGLTLSPIAYFARGELNAPYVAMITASHNDNGWTGIKMGSHPPLTFGPDEIFELKKLALAPQDVPPRDGGVYETAHDVYTSYAEKICDRRPYQRPLKAVVACGNGTAGAFVPQILRRVGIDVIEVDCELDYNFPRYNPNPESVKMLKAMSKAVLEHKADLALGFDGDGDRCGVIDNEGKFIFSDKLGVMICRNLCKSYSRPHFIADVKSTELFFTDPVLQAAGASCELWKTGHSHIKRRRQEVNALAAFEKSGHFFFGAPLGDGYDDATIAALMVLDLLEAEPDKSLAQLFSQLPTTFPSPSMAAHCPDEEKYRVAAEISTYLHEQQSFADSSIDERVTINGIRVGLADGSWFLIRPSSNMPELVVVIESRKSATRVKEIFSAIKLLFEQWSEIGHFNQQL